MSGHEGRLASYSGRYARFYDLLTQHKDYSSETFALVELLGKERFGLDSVVLDVGCGTGTHAGLLSAHGFTVTGLDVSTEMIDIAISKFPGVSFVAGDLEDFKPGSFDFVTSLFNVVNCLDSLAEMRHFLRNIHDLLRPGGALLFEAWNGVAVIADPPVEVIRTYATEKKQIRRVATPKLDPFEQRLSIEYRVWEQKIDTWPSSVEDPSFSSTHRLVLFTPIELRDALATVGFENITFWTALPELRPASAHDRMLAIYTQKP